MGLAVLFLNLQCYNGKKMEKSNVEVFVEMQKSEIIKTEIVENKISIKKTDRNEIVTFAKKFIGVPYVYASQDPKKGFDCSGFVNYIYKNFDIIVPRSSSGFKDFGKKINIVDVKVGDILVFMGYQDSTSIGHLGIVCEANGLNSKFIHASSGKAMQVTISELNSNHYSKRFYKAIDVIE